MKCIIPCAGRSTRMKSDIPKVLLKVNNLTLLSHVTYEWSTCVDEFIIIVSRENEQLIRQSSGKATFIVQDPLRGIADAILQAEQYVDGKFIVALGDCLHCGKFREGSFALGVGVWKTDDLGEVNKSYLVSIGQGLIVRVREKPNIRPTDMVVPFYCGMGTYFFDQRVFDYIRKTPLSLPKNEIEITDVIQNMIEAGEKINPVWFTGKYINITYPEDIKKAEGVIQ